MGVLVTVFFVQVALHLLNIAGASAVSNLVWRLFTLLPTPYAKDEQEIRKLRGDVVRLHREMNAVSAQDDFAKWARLRREHDKAKDKHDKKDSSTRAFRTNFDRAVGALRFLFVQGFNFFLNSYYSKTPVYWLPQGWVPYHVEWLLSCPRAPLGSISVNVWGLACGTVIAMISEAVRATYKIQQERTSVSKVKEEPIQMGTKKAAVKEKKEL